MDALKELDRQAASSARIHFDPECSGGRVAACNAAQESRLQTGVRAGHEENRAKSFPWPQWSRREAAEVVRLPQAKTINEPGSRIRVTDPAGDVEILAGVSIARGDFADEQAVLESETLETVAASPAGGTVGGHRAHGAPHFGEFRRGFSGRTQFPRSSRSQRPDKGARSWRISNCANVTMALARL